MRTLAILLIGLMLVGTAEARPRHRPGPPGPRVGLRVVINPWAFGYAPAPRAGWVWVDGQYAPDGTWIPGYWRPAVDQPGWIWVPGHWDGGSYVEGYWREASRDGFVWVDGYYEGGRWVPGYWEPVAPPPPPGPPPQPDTTHHPYE